MLIGSIFFIWLIIHQSRIHGDIISFFQGNNLTEIKIRTAAPSSSRRTYLRDDITVMEFNVLKSLKPVDLVFNFNEINTLA